MLAPTQASGLQTSCTFDKNVYTCAVQLNGKQMWGQKAQRGAGKARRANLVRWSFSNNPMRKNPKEFFSPGWLCVPCPWLLQVLQFLCTLARVCRAVLLAAGWLGSRWRPAPAAPAQLSRRVTPGRSAHSLGHEHVSVGVLQEGGGGSGARTGESASGYGCPVGQRMFGRRGVFHQGRSTGHFCSKLHALIRHT